MLPGTGELVEELMQREGPGAHSGPGKGKDDKHKPPVVFWDWETKKAEQRSPATTRPPESHEHQDVFRQYVAPSTGCTCGGIADETNMTDLFHRVGHGEGDGYALCC